MPGTETSRACRLSAPHPARGSANPEPGRWKTWPTKWLQGPEAQHDTSSAVMLGGTAPLPTRSSARPLGAILAPHPDLGFSPGLCHGPCHPLPCTHATWDHVWLPPGKVRRPPTYTWLVASGNHMSPVTQGGYHRVVVHVYATGLSRKPASTDATRLLKEPGSQSEAGPARPGTQRVHSCQACGVGVRAEEEGKEEWSWRREEPKRRRKVGVKSRDTGTRQWGQDGGRETREAIERDGTTFSCVSPTILRVHPPGDPSLIPNVGHPRAGPSAGPGPATGETTAELLSQVHPRAEGRVRGRGHKGP